MQVTLALLLTTLLAVSVSAAPTDSYTPSSDGHLHIIRVADNSLEAIFYNADAGIRIRANSLSLSLYSMDGEELLLSGDKPHGSSLFATIMGHSFLEYNTTLEDGRVKVVDYSVPKSLAEQTKEAMESARVEQMLSQLSDEGTKQAIEFAFQELFKRSEITLIERAAIALGQAGVMGYKNQGALNFYMVARALTRARRRAEGYSEGIEIESYDDMYKYEDQAIGHHQKYFLRPIISHGVSQLSPHHYCPNNGLRCRRCPVGKNCLGMCGPGCHTCLSFVCGDCCYHQGCYDHDMCCVRNAWSMACLIPVGFSCLLYVCYL